MKKVLALAIMLLAFCLVGCSQNDDINDLAQPQTNLEFWIAENVDNVDFSDYQIKYGMMGGTEYYGTGYIPEVDENRQQTDPKHCVLYTVTSYPDYSSKTLHITYISITDPSIEFYGLSLNSTQEEIRYQMEEKQGFAIEKLGDNTLIARKGDYTFSFSKDIIRISVNVTNKEDIVF
ncbi:MAG: hypothetical protein J6D23_07255 [Clostridia bacterium]|nr:hypothetical protein [Clostridia bacterium]